MANMGLETSRIWCHALRGGGRAIDPDNRCDTRLTFYYPFR
jgi:hypothetical protein